jgi:membrane protein
VLDAAAGDDPHDPTPKRRGLRRFLYAPADFALGVIRRSAIDDITGVASQFAYNAFLATVPFLFILVAVTGLVASPETYERLIDDNEGAIPDEIEGLLRQTLTTASANAQEATIFLFIGIAAALYISANVMGALIGGLDRSRGVRHRSWLFGKVVALGYAAGAGIMVLLTSVALVGGPPLVNWLLDRLGAGATNVGTDVVYPIGGVAVLAFTLILYMYGPNAPRRSVWVELPGAVFATALGLSAARLFAIYVDNFDSYNRVYGSLGAVVIYMISLFLTGVVALLGAEVNEQIVVNRERRRIRKRQAENKTAEVRPPPTEELIPEESSASDEDIGR